eukprot:364424-Chlamydomonas_euryale.AAC.2
MHALREVLSRHTTLPPRAHQRLDARVHRIDGRRASSQMCAHIHMFKSQHALSQAHECSKASTLFPKRTSALPNMQFFRNLACPPP